MTNITTERLNLHVWYAHRIMTNERYYISDSHVSWELRWAWARPGASRSEIGAWGRCCGSLSRRSRSTFLWQPAASLRTWSRSSDRRASSGAEWDLHAEWEWDPRTKQDLRQLHAVPRSSAFSRRALERSPSSPLYELPSNSMSMASCLLLSMKLLLMVRCTERAPSFS